MLKIRGNLQVLVLILLMLITLEGGSAWFDLSSYSYSTGYQGAHAQFAGVKYQEEKYSGIGFDTTMDFDPDAPTSDMCNLVGEMTSVFIPSESLSNMPDWIDLDWVQQASYISNPKASYEWESGNFTYTMEEWRLRWYFSISADWDKPGVWQTNTEYINRRYSNTQIWFEFDLTPVWYFEGQSNAYFAIAKMKVADVNLHSLDNDGNEVDPCLETSVAPDSQGSQLPIYYGLFAEQNPADKDAREYQGKKLNPDLFTSKVYTYFTLVNFGTTYWTETSSLLLPVAKWKGDVVTVAVDVTVFVIGEWTVQDIESIEEIEGETGYGRTAQVGGGGWTWEAWLSTPANRLLLVLIAGLAVLVIIAILFPSLLMILPKLFSSLTGGRRR